jgi:hypothetical protein
MTEKPVQGVVDKATDSDAFEFAARAGFAMTGVLHLLVAYIILRIAFGSGGNADQSGALATLAGQPGGALILWVAAVALLALGLWRLAETVVGPHPSEKSHQSQQNAGMSAQLMQSGWGKTLLVLVGLGVIAVGGYHVYKGASKRFLKDLRTSGGSGITALGVAGYVAKGLVLAGAGILVIVASLRSDPTKSAGIDVAVKTLGGAPFGKVLLIVAAAGFAAYGFYSFVRSRYGRM